MWCATLLYNPGDCNPGVISPDPGHGSISPQGCFGPDSTSVQFVTCHCNVAHTEMGHRTLKLSRVKDQPTQAAQVSKPIIHSRAHTRAKSFRDAVRRTSLVLQGHGGVVRVLLVTWRKAPTAA
jgi:hypothetical protein